ncbi:MAG: tetratricopeptide repeat protein, partial [Halofilum sp. (in: g-proteobacteria)]
MESSEPIQLGSAAPVKGWESAVRAYQRGQPERARRALAPVLASAPGDDEVLHLAGLIEVQAECWDEAAGFLAEAAARAPERSGRWLALASARRALGQARAAASALHEALARDPCHAPALNDLGTSYHALGFYRDALDCHERALEVAPDLVDALRCRPRLLARLRQTDAARAAYV